MGKYIDLSTVSLEINSPLWEVAQMDGETVLKLTNNVSTTSKIGTVAYYDEEHVGKVALIGEPIQNYRMQTEMRFLRSYKENAGWFGFAIRAQDTLNYEIVWFMPKAEAGVSSAYVPVAHGIVPWWTEAYAKQEKGNPYIPINAWFKASIDVIDDEFTVYVEDKPILTKKITYYFMEGRPGFFVGTVTDAAFRRIQIEDLDA